MCVGTWEAVHGAMVESSPRVTGENLRSVTRGATLFSPRMDRGTKQESIHVLLSTDPLLLLGSHVRSD